MRKFLKYFKLQDYFLNTFQTILSCSNSNLNKFFNILNSEFQSLIDYINRIYLSLYPCEGLELNKLHEIELGIPDNNFKFDNEAQLYQFTYTFPIPFGDGSTNKKVTPKDRQNDIIIKKCLMNDNSEIGYKRIASIYCLSIEIEFIKGNPNNAFTYTFPIPFGDFKAYDEVRIKVYGNPSQLILKKLTAIYNYIKRVDVVISIEDMKQDNIYNPLDYKTCINQECEG
jgi:hypothetical protein